MKISVLPLPAFFTDRSGNVFEITAFKNKLQDNEHKIQGYTFQERLRSDAHDFCEESTREFLREYSACIPLSFAKIPGILCLFPEVASDFTYVYLFSWQDGNWGFHLKPLWSHEFSKWHYPLMIKKVE